MAAISTHLHNRPYQVATTTNPSLPFRQWDHKGTWYAITHRSAAYDAYKGRGVIVSESTGSNGVIYRFSCGLSVCVGF